MSDFYEDTSRILTISQHCQPVPPQVDKLPIEKTGEAPVWCLHTLIWLSSRVQYICDAE